MDPCIQIPLEPAILHDIVEKAKDFCLMHGKTFFNYKSKYVSKLFNLFNYVLIIFFIR